MSAEDPLNANLDCYIVGGAVRDALLKLPVSDRDWVVVGSTPAQMQALGFRAVGKDFPVFLHPHTQEEYALARTERKSGRGYTGFVCDASPTVTLEEDLSRRDLSINAIARDRHGRLIDPFNGLADLQAGVFRHVSPAFAEDPLRILRLARFAARFTHFVTAPQTLLLMQQMVSEGEVDHLVAERVWQELARGLMEAQPARMIRELRSCGALARILPELDRLFGIPQPAAHHPEIDTGEHVLLVIDYAAAAGYSLEVRWACLLHDLGKGDTPAELLPRHHGHEQQSAVRAREVSLRLKAPVACRELAELVAREHLILARYDELKPQTVVKVLERCDAIRRPQRFEQALQACACDHHGRGGPARAPWTAAGKWLAALAAVRAVDAGAIAAGCAERSQIPAAVHAARVAAVRRLTPSSAAGTAPA
jgi:tRNA nucleotidyltransferase (CCA-adding enzyme)